MLSKNGRLKLAIQKDGRITEDSVNLLRAAGLDFDIRSRALVAPCRDGGQGNGEYCPARS